MRTLPRTLTLGAIALMILAVSLSGLIARGQEGPDPDYRPEATPVPPPGDEAAVAGPPASPLPANSLQCVDVRGSATSVTTTGDLANYVDQGRDLLQSIAAADPNREVRAGINFAQLIPPKEISGLIEENNLKWQNIYWEASNGVHGAISSAEGAQSLDEVESALKSSGELSELDFVGGAYYVVVDGAPLSALEKLQYDQRVALVDLGRLAEFDAAQDSGDCIWFALPDPLWYAAREVGYDLSIE